MQKVDRLGWAVGFALKTYGLSIGIRANDPAGLVQVCQHLPHEWKTTSAPVVDRLYSIIVGGHGPKQNVRRFNLLYADHNRIARSTELDAIFERLESDLRITVAEFARHRVFVHAGVVGWNGKAILVPGRSYSGKSTLIAEMVKAGATYYSDEYAVIDDRGRIHPFRKPLEMREEGAFEQSKIHVEELGGRFGVKPLPVGLILISQFKSGGKWRPRTLTPGEGVLALLSHTVSARRNPERALATLQHAVSAARILKGTRGEARQVVDRVLDAASRKSVPT